MTSPPATPGLPRWVAARKFAARSQCLRGRVDARDLPRLMGAVAGADVPVDVELTFVDAEDGPEIHGCIETRVTMTCERCLEPMEVALTAKPALGLVRDDRDAAALPERLDPCLASDEDLDLFELVEDELLLTLPIVAKHQKQCRPLPPPEAVAADSAESPFRVLERLKPQR